MCHFSAPINTVDEGWVLDVYNKASECLLITICKGRDGDQTNALQKGVGYWVPKTHHLVTTISVLS